MPRKYPNKRLEAIPDLIMSILLSPKEATETGKYNIKVYFREDSLFRPHSKQPTRTIPLRDNPGSRAHI